MKILCLAGGGRICREAILDLVQFSDFERITVADVNQAAVDEVVAWLDDRRVDAAAADVRNTDSTIALMKRYDIVMDGTPISLNDQSTACIALAAVHGINLNGMSREWDWDDAFRQIGKTCVPGFGMTPGITNLMAMHAARQLERVDTVRCSHGAFRPIAFSEAIAEPLTLSRSLVHQGVRLIEALGTWPPKNMRLIRAMHEWGMLRNDPVTIDGHTVGVLDAIFAHCLQSPEGCQTDLYGYALHVEVIGVADGETVQHVLTHTHPPSDGSVPDWQGLRAYTRCVGIPMAIGARLIAAGRVHAVGTVPPELAFESDEVFSELERRGMFIQHQVHSPPIEEP